VLVVLILVVAGIVTLGALYVVDRAVDQVARADIEAEYQELVRYQSEYKVVSVADAIDFRLSLGAVHPTIYMLARNDGSVVVGSYAHWPVELSMQPGWYRFETDLDGRGQVEALAKVELFDDEFPVLVARKLSAYSSLRNEFLPFMLGSIVVLAVILFIVVFRSNRQFQQRIDELNAVLVEAGRGNLDARINLTPTAPADEITFLASQINETLDENARLIIGLETVSQTAAHEINKELSHLRDVAATSNQPELVASADELLKLLREILELAKIKSSTDALMGRLDLATAAQAAVELYRDAFEEADVMLDVSVESNKVLGQSHLVINAVANLLSNALRHSPPKGCVALRVTRQGDSATVSVADQGAGTLSDDLREVLSQARRGKVAGYGFGLRFVQAVALRHGAKLRLVNLNPGLQVSLTFPVVA
jgi:signal transduction histidine kinase